MKALFADSASGVIGLLIFFGFFIAMLIWLFRPNAKKKFEEHGNIPLEDDHDGK